MQIQGFHRARSTAMEDNLGMKFLYFLADSFIAFFGITRPTEKARTQAAFFIVSLTLLVLIGVAAVGLAIHSVIH